MFSPSSDIVSLFLLTHQGNEARLYELITRHFLACLSEDAKGAETTVRLLIGAVNNNTEEGGEVFEAKGLVIHSRNYLEVYYPYESWSERFMPSFTLGEIIKPDKIEVSSEGLFNQSNKTLYSNCPK